jgi:hypothetical protein
MSFHVLPVFILLASSLLLAQNTEPKPTSSQSTPAEAATQGKEVGKVTSELGFSYSLPSDWNIVDTRPMLPVIQQQAAKSATSEVEKKGVSCVQVPFKATHGDPASSVVVVTIGFDCLGQRYLDSDLASFAEGVAKSLKKNWNIVDPVYAAYMLGSHSFWIERASGSSLAHPEVKRGLDVVCSMLKKGAVCWMAFTVSDADLQTFEHGQVILDDDAPAALVPPTAFDKKPAS